MLLTCEGMCAACASGLVTRMLTVWGCSFGKDSAAALLPACTCRAWIVLHVERVFCAVPSSTVGLRRPALGHLCSRGVIWLTQKERVSVGALAGCLHAQQQRQQEF